MARTALLALALLAGVAAVSATPGIRWIRFSGAGDDPKPEPSCLTYTDQDSCLQHACGWCSNSALGDLGCISEPLAKLMPQAIAECKINDDPSDDDDDDDDDEVSSDKPDKPPKPPTSCGDNKEKHDCLTIGAEEGDCAWCAGDFMPPSCVGVKAAEWIPEQVAKCKMPKKHKKHDDDDDDDDDDDESLTKKKKPKKLPATCDEIKDKRECVKDGSEEGECAWCTGKFMPEMCMGADKAKFLPEQVATCKMPKKHAKLEKKGGSGYGPGGGDWPSGGGDWPSGGGDYPGPSGGGGDYPGPGGGGGQGCMALKSKKKCLKGTDGEACAWCGKSSFLGSPCVSEQTAKFIPSFMSKCKMGKKKKHSNADDKLAVA